MAQKEALKICKKKSKKRGEKKSSYNYLAVNHLFSFFPSFFCLFKCTCNLYLN